MFSYILIPESNQPHGILDTGYRIQDTGYRIQDTRYRIQDTAYRIQVQNTGNRIQHTVYKISAKKDNGFTGEILILLWTNQCLITF